MLLGSAKNARYMSDGASTASSGAGTREGYAAAPCSRSPGWTRCARRSARSSASATGTTSRRQDIDAFAEVTGDHQWIHTDPARATQTPFGGTIAHGYYTLSLHPRFAAQIVAFEGFAFAVNYGLNKVRFPAPLPVGNRVRMRARSSTSRTSSAARRSR